MPGIALLDPAFIATILVLDRAISAWQVAVGHIIWSLVSQAPLATLLAAIATAHRSACGRCL